LETESGQTLLHVTGAIDAGVPGSQVFEGSLEACRAHHLPHEVLNADQINRRFPGYHLPDDCMAVYQPDGGFLEPEKCIHAFVERAVARGARILVNASARGWSRSQGGIAVELENDTIYARQLVLCGGAWMPKLAPSLAPLLRPERQVVAWFEVEDKAAFGVDRFPVFVMTTTFGTFYGFPEFGVPGFKIGKYHHRSETVDPDSMDRTVHASDEAVLRECVESIFPGANGPVVRSSTCIFTNTPDEHFIIDRLPDAPEVLVVSACSGHGFKFCSVVGEIVADLVTDGRSNHDLSLFRLDRFGNRGLSGV
jgi:sarcosine oxidase